MNGLDREDQLNGERAGGRKKRNDMDGCCRKALREPEISVTMNLGWPKLLYGRGWTGNTRHMGVLSALIINGFVEYKGRSGDYTDA